MFVASASPPPLEFADLDSLTADRLEDEIVSIASEVYALTCRWLCLIAEYDRRRAHEKAGFATCSQWLAWRCGLSDRAARDHVRVARALGELPLLRAAFGSGELSYSKARAVARVAGPDDEGDLIELASHATTAQLERIVRAYRGALSLKEAEKARQNRFFNWSWEEDGSLSFRGSLPAEEAALFMRAIESARDGIHEDRWAQERSPGADAQVADKTAQRSEVTNADAIVAIAETQLASGPASRASGERYQVVVHVDEKVLAGANEGRCATEDGSPLATETARRLACDATITPMSESKQPGKAPLVGRRTRSVPPALARAIRARDGGCRFPGCNNRRFVDNHHIKPWAQGGETNEENLVQLCRRHHHLIHEGGFSVERRGDRFVFRRPDGRTIARVPCMAPRRPSCDPPRRRSTGRLPIGGLNRLDLEHTMFALMCAHGSDRRARAPD